MLRIVGAGCAYPSTVLSNSLIEGLCKDISPGWALQHTGIETRHSVMKLEHFQSGASADPWKTRDEMICQSSDLSLEAASLAIERAGISPSDIGMVIGETATPFQTAPSEAQRLGGRLGLKVPAYDVASGAGPLPLHVSVLSSWKLELIPNYVLCVSCNTPTQRTDYGSGLGGVYFGDAAAAVVVSPSREDGMVIIDSCLEKLDPASICSVSMDLYGLSSVNEDLMRKKSSTEMLRMFGLASSRNALQTKECCFIGDQFNYPDLLSVCEEAGISAERHWHNLRQRGYCLGASATAVLAENWGRCASGETLIVAQAGIGAGAGYVVLKA